MTPFLVLGVALLLVLLAAWWFDHSRRREGRAPYVDRRPTRPTVGVDVAGEMVPPPPTRPIHHPAREDSSLADRDVERDDDHDPRP